MTTESGYGRLPEGGCHAARVHYVLCIHILLRKGEQRARSSTALTTSELHPRELGQRVTRGMYEQNTCTRGLRGECPGEGRGEWSNHSEIAREQTLCTHAHTHDRSASTSAGLKASSSSKSPHALATSPRRARPFPVPSDRAHKERKMHQRAMTAHERKVNDALEEKD